MERVSSGAADLVDKSRKIFFIIGFPRCGTKLLRTVLNNHANVFISGELMFLPYLLDNWERYGDLSKIDNFRVMHREIMNTFYFAVRANQGIELIQAEQWHASCIAFDPTGILLPLIRHETGAPQSDDVWLGDKSPNYTTHLRQIKNALPEAKIIHIVRDVRDAALSARKIWHKNIFRFVQRWADGMRVLWADLELVESKDYLELRYEDLLNDPISTLKRITNFLGLDFHEDMVLLNKPAENFGDAKAAVGILSGNTQKYMTQLTAVEQEKIESICSEVLSHYGYAVNNVGDDKSLSRFRMAWYMVIDIFHRLIFDLRLGRGVGFIAKGMLSRARTRL